MKTIDYSAMQTYCQEQAGKGKEISVSWEGGNDEGSLFLRIDGEDVPDPTPLQQAILDLVEDHLGYGSFAGDFYTDGTVTYNLEENSFLGEDNCGGTNSAQSECDITFSVPEDMWFERMDISVLQNGIESGLELSISLHIGNGPYPPVFDELQSRFEADIRAKVDGALMEIEDVEGLWINHSPLREDFRASGGQLEYHIGSFSYSYFVNETNEISVPLYDLLQPEGEASPQVIVNP